jgi:hypothetical protein
MMSADTAGAATMPFAANLPRAPSPPPVLVAAIRTETPPLPANSALARPLQFAHQPPAVD